MRIPAVIPAWTVTTTTEERISLRDEFAKCALIGWLATWQSPTRYPEDVKDINTNNVADLCYDFADAMLRAREVEP